MGTFDLCFRLYLFADVTDKNPGIALDNVVHGVAQIFAVEKKDFGLVGYVGFAGQKHFAESLVISWQYGILKKLDTCLILKNDGVLRGIKNNNAYIYILKNIRIYALPGTGDSAYRTVSFTLFTDTNVHGSPVRHPPGKIMIKLAGNCACIRTGISKQTFLYDGHLIAESPAALSEMPSGNILQAVVC
ncbi:MAG: hypothetical protein OEW04_12700 [Nitrospirota bacterium]|nr:hypothetical protein [Nitrospirota bacterium]